MTTDAPAVRLARVGWTDLDAAARAAWLDALRPAQPDADVGDIIATVRRDGDAGLRALTKRFDGADLADPWATSDELDAAEREADPTLRAALEASIAAVRRYHAEQRNALRQERRVRTLPGVTAWRRWQPLDRAGGYVPGGKAAYASSLIMLAVPAQLAGVGELVVATPPDGEGRVAAVVLLAARILGVPRVLKAGGAQAIAALAYGTPSVPRVDRIFGAGNAWVTAAKRAISADVAIDLPAGPSELVVAADASADPELIALDLLAQAEHGPDSLAILVTDDAALADAVEARLAAAAAPLATGDRALATLERGGRIVLVASADEAVDLIDAIAAEHVSLQLRDAEAVSRRVRRAGAIFIGAWSAVAAGDYATGTNHILPTGGAARAYGGVSVESFGRWIEVQRLTPAGITRVAPTVARIAAAEGLAAHGASVARRAELAASAEEVADDPLELLRRPEAVQAYPSEPSDEELAAQAGVSPDQLLRADMNTLGGGPLPGLQDAYYEPARVVEYGDLAYRSLRSALAGLTGVEPRRILPGAGADELIRLMTMMTVANGDAVVIPTPTFPMFAVEAELAGARVVPVPRTLPAERQPVEVIRRAAEAEAARLVWLCTPNNPTGDAYELDEIRALATDLPAMVVVDEVYLEFLEAERDAAPGTLSAAVLQAELPNVIVLRSLSKAFGVAGARVGYLILPDGLAARFDATRLPLAIGSASEVLAIAALADPETARGRRRELVAARRRLATLLEARGVEQLPAVANFVTFHPPDAASLADALFRRGIVVRAYTSGLLAGWMRITARLGDEERRIVGALEELL
jgi:histidinol-phosphate aminotransferase